MAKIKSSLMKSGLPADTNPLAPVKKESSQKAVDDKVEVIISPPYSLEALAELFDMNSYHSRCCKVKAGVTALLGYSIYNPDKNDAQPDDDYKKVDELISGSIKDLYNIQLDSEIFGNGYIEIVRNNKKEVAELYHIGSRESSLVRRKDKILLKQIIGSKEIFYKPFEGEKYDGSDEMHEFILIKNYNPKSRYYGSPDYLGAIPAMYLDASANEYNTRRFKNNAIPDAIIKLYGFDKDPETEKDIKEFFQGNFKGVENVGKVLMLWADKKEGNEIEVDKMAAEIKEASFRGLRIDNREEVLAAHGVPPRLAGIESVGKLSGGGEVKEQLKLFNEIVIIPRQKSLARMLNKIIAEGIKISNWKIKFDTFEFANAAEDAKFYETMISSGILDPDEARTELGYAPRKKPGEPVNKNYKLTALSKVLKQLRRTLEDMRNDD